jgi:hypothetical protein
MSSLLPPECQDYRYAPPHLDHVCTFTITPRTTGDGIEQGGHLLIHLAFHFLPVRESVQQQSEAYT